MDTIRCPYCHEYVASTVYAKHEAEHTKLQPDGQQAEYVTLPSEERFDESLEGVPQVYRHNKCGTCTGMPEEIIRSYLKNPYLYLADRTFCCGCGKHVPWRECIWVDTGEDLQSYTDKLRVEKPELRPGIFTWMLIRFVNLFR